MNCSTFMGNASPTGLAARYRHRLMPSGAHNSWSRARPDLRQSRNGPLFPATLILPLYKIQLARRRPQTEAGNRVIRGRRDYSVAENDHSNSRRCTTLNAGRRIFCEASLRAHLKA